MSRLVAFIIGAGANIGQHTAAALTAKGYQVVLGSRNPSVEQLKNDGFFPVAVDAQNPQSIKAAFATITAEVGPPSVVIFNAASFTVAPTPAEPLTLSLESLTQQTALGLAVFAAAQEALSGFRSDALKDMPKTFIATGNPLPWVLADEPKWLGLSIQKVVQWRLVELLAHAYSKENIRFYFATLVDKTGGLLVPLSAFFTSGPQHAQVYLDLIAKKEQVDWDFRFTLDAQQWKKA
ncbi:hypothetical protein B0H10DRAFT_72273 [Mycena sp. CBHHK59/15]|nr:hypothetical protein B0H10DRAFT_72273 [Mycena sp. CBHHK59/15]